LLDGYDNFELQVNGAVRLMMDSILQQVISGKNLPYEQIDQWIKNEDVQEVERFAAALINAWDDSPRERWRYTGSYGRLVEGLALNAGQKKLDMLLAVLAHRSEDDALMRRTAAQLGSRQTPDALNNAAKSPTHANLWEYVVHELVIEGVKIAAYENLSQVARQIVQRQHPLSVLPLQLVSSEANIRHYRRRYSVGNASVSSPYGVGANTQKKIGLSKRSAEVTLEETTTPDLQALLSVPFAQWSNGNVEARRFQAQSALSADAITETSLLPDLNLDCLKNVLQGSVGIWAVTSNQVINVLFSAAANGGAYTHGVGNPYGRLTAWKTVAALLDQPDDTPISALNELIAKTQWFEMKAESVWFANVAWDAALIALSQDRRVLTFLAATDSD
jgi:hypothetical protein